MAATYDDYNFEECAHLAMDAIGEFLEDGDETGRSRWYTEQQILRAHEEVMGEDDVAGVKRALQELQARRKWTSPVCGATLVCVKGKYRLMNRSQQ